MSKVNQPVLLLLLAMSAACSVPVNDFEAPVDLPKTFSVSGQAKVPVRWWQAFNDEALNRLVEQALSGNFTIQAAFKRLQQVQAIARKAGSELIPAINGTSAAAEKLTGNTTADSVTLGLAAAYEIDLWGRIRANIQAAELDAQAAAEDINAAAISVSAEVAAAWYKLIEQRRQLQLLDRQIQVNRDYVTMVTIRFRLGQATAADVFQQNQALQFVIGSRMTVLANIQVLENQLAVLTGRAPGNADIPERNDFPALPPIPETGLTADLIQRRPDLRKAYLRIQAADQRVASAIADRFPKLSLAATLDNGTADLQSLFNNWMATIAGNLVLPLVDGRRRVSEVERNRALAEEALNNYADALLNAAKEVENALAQEHQQYQLTLSLDRQLQFSQQANGQIRLRYVYGAMDFLRVLSSLSSQQNLERNRLSAQQQLFGYRIALYRALAGSGKS